MVMWWAIFSEGTPHFLASWFPVYKQILLFYLVFHLIISHIYCNGPFLSDIIAYNTFSSVFICFIVVCGWGNPSSAIVIQKVIDVFPLWKTPPTSDLAWESTTCLSIIKYVQIGSLYGDGRCGYFFGLDG